MKTVMKKLLSIMLVAILLVSAVPFQAFAAGNTVNVVAYYDTMEATGQVSVGDETCANELISLMDPEWADFYTLSSYDLGTGAKTNGSEKFAVTDGMTVYIALVEKDDSGSGSGSSVPGVDVIPGPGTTPPSGGNGSGSTTTPPSGGNGSGSTTTPDGDSAPEATVIPCTLTVDYKLADTVVRTHNTTVGTPYSDFVGVPARNGYDFRGWYSEREDGFINVAEDLIMGDDTITAMWAPASKYSLTLDENRGAEETINRVKQVTYGLEIGELPTPEREGYVFLGWKLNGKYIDEETVWSIPGDGTAYAQWRLESDTEGEAMGGNGAVADGKVYLEIYVNGDTSSAEKRVNITDLAKDNKITRAEVESVVKKYVTAKAGYSLAYEGLFDEESWWWYTRDPETDGKDYIIVNKDGDDYVYVMVNNVKTVAADPTNPKTGDGIALALAAMMSTGGAALVLGKKKFF